MCKLYLFDEYENVTEEFIVRALQLLPKNRRVIAERLTDGTVSSRI